MNTSEIKELLSEVLPAVDFDSDFLFSELDSLSVATILYVLSEKYGITLDAGDVTPRNFKTIDSLARMVRSKLSLESRIQHFATVTPDKPAVICGEKSLTYRQLWDAIAAKADSLKAEGLKPHEAYVYRTVQDIDFIVTYCAVHCLHAVAVPLGSLVSDENFRDISDEVKSYPFGDDVADALYTTGTTGKSKGVMISETCLTACSDNFISDLHFTSDLLFIISGPLNHIASLFKIHPTLSVGATICILDGLKDMNVFFDVFDLPFKKFATFMVPASLRLIMQFSYDRLCALADKFDFIETGAAPISRADMEMLCKALPHTRMYNTYGGTEFGCATAYNFNDGRYIEGCIGRPLKNAHVEISEDGHLVVSGLGVMCGYINDEESTKKVIVDGKVRMSDLGYFDDEGMIHITGRDGDVINIGGYKINPIEVENATSSFPGVKDCICVAGKHPIIGQVLKLIVVMDGTAELDRHALAVYLKSKLEAYKVPTMYETAESIKYTYNGKLDRKAYL